MTTKHPAPPITLDNQLIKIADCFNDEVFLSYALWLDKQDCPAKSYLDHPIESEQQLNSHKVAFEHKTGWSLGAYLRIKRVYFILNNTQTNTHICEFCYLDTPIGTMLAVFDKDKLCLLEFLERKMLETQLNQIVEKKHCHFRFQTLADNPLAQPLQTQLNEYFMGKRRDFDIPLDTHEDIASEFQREVWQTLQNIDYGTTISYQEEAEQMGKPTAMRAVANANGKNRIAIIIPCHRVIRKNGGLGGYGGGVWRKRYLLDLEGKHNHES